MSYSYWDTTFNTIHCQENTKYGVGDIGVRYRFLLKRISVRAGVSGEDLFVGKVVNQKPVGLNALRETQHLFECCFDFSSRFRIYLVD